LLRARKVALAYAKSMAIHLLRGSAVSEVYRREPLGEEEIAMGLSSRVLGYPLSWLPLDLVAGVTVAAYAIPVSLAYATLAGLPPQVGLYAYLTGGLGYALLDSSRSHDRSDVGLAMPGR
jgi:sulfate permease family protein